MKKLIFPTIVFLLYVLSYFLNIDLFNASVSNSKHFLIEMVQVMPVIMVFTIIIEVWIPKKTITENLGSESRLKGTILSLVLGSVSAGPIYAAFPIAASLYKKGASIKNIVIIISSWAVIKVPMLANEAKFIGVEFMLLRWILTVISIVMIGYIAGLILNRRDILKVDKETESIYVDRSLCILCGICHKRLPDCFVKRNGRIEVCCEDKSKIEEIVLQCPTKAIKVKEL